MVPLQSEQVQVLTNSVYARLHNSDLILAETLGSPR